MEKGSLYPLYPKLIQLHPRRCPLKDRQNQLEEATKLASIVETLDTCPRIVVPQGRTTQTSSASIVERRATSLGNAEHLEADTTGLQLRDSLHKPASMLLSRRKLVTMERNNKTWKIH